MTDPQAIPGMLASYRTLADGTLRLTIDLDEKSAQPFHTLFPSVRVDVAIAPIRSEAAHEQSE